MPVTARLKPAAEQPGMPREETGLVSMTAGIVSAYVARNHIPIAELPNALRSVHQALAGLHGGNGLNGAHVPAVSVKKSITDTHLICLEDGKALKMLKRYLRSHYNLSPEAYRAKWNLPHDYPMVAPAYARVRSAFAKSSGLGRFPTRVTQGQKRKAA